MTKFKRWVVAAIAMGAGVAMAGEMLVEGADGSPCMRLKASSTNVVSVIITGGGTSLTVTVDGLANTVDGCTNLAQYTVKLAACTNYAGSKPLTVDGGGALSTDTILGKLLSGTNTASAGPDGKWVELPWDTSSCGFYQLYLANSTYDPGISALRINKITGEPTGTGDVTLGIYVDKVLKYRRVWNSPYYTLPSVMLSDGTAVSTNTMTTINTINIDLPVSIPKAANQAVIIRATRGTTATTGVLGATVE